MACTSEPKAFPYYLNELRQQKKVVLKERIGRHVPAIGRNSQHHLQASFRGRLRAHQLQLLINRRLGNLARFDIQHQAIVRPEEAQIEALPGFVPLSSNHNAVAVTEGLGAREHRGDQARVQSTNALEQVAHLLAFELKL